MQSTRLQSTMASSMVQSLLGKYAEYFAAAGFVAVSYVALKLALSILSGIRTFVLSKPLGLSTNLKKMGAWAVVTGCTDGIGKVYTEQIAKKGMNMILISRTRSKLEEVAKEIESKYKVKTLIIVADFSKGASIYPDIKDQLSGLDIGVLVNNVGHGYSFPAYLHEVPDRDKHFRDLIEVNVTSVTMMTSIVIQGMVEKKKGVIINMSSASGMVPTPLLTVYSACKGYVDFFSVCVQEEYKSKGIIVQSVMPYFVTSKMSKIRKATLTVPDPDTFVKSALATVGLESRTNGYWVHSVMAFFSLAMPVWLMSKISISNLNISRIRAFKKLAAAKEK